MKLSSGRPFLVHQCYKLNLVFLILKEIILNCYIMTNKGCQRGANGNMSPGLLRLCRIFKMNFYFHLSPLEKVLHFIRTNLNSLYPRCFVLSLVEISFVVLKKIFKCRQYRYFTVISPLIKVWLFN